MSALPRFINNEPCSLAVGRFVDRFHTFLGTGNHLYGAFPPHELQHFACFLARFCGLIAAIGKAGVGRKMPTHDATDVTCGAKQLVNELE